MDKLQLERHLVAHVGDSLEHDVAGAAGVGLSSVFVAAGVHGGELGCSVGTPVEQLERAAMTRLFARWPHTPTHMLSTFAW